MGVGEAGQSARAAAEGEAPARFARLAGRQKRRARNYGENAIFCATGWL